MFSNLFPLHPTVVNRPDFYYHLTAIDGIDLPQFAVFRLKSDIVTPGNRQRYARQMGCKMGQNTAFQEAELI